MIAFTKPENTLLCITHVLRGFKARASMAIKFIFCAVL